MLKPLAEREPTVDLIPASKAPALTAEQFGHLADLPPELEWLANIPNVKARRAYI